MRKTAVETAKTETQRLADNIAIEQKNLEASAEQLISVMSQLPYLKNKNKKRMTTILINTVKLNPQYTNLLVAGKNGEVWAHGLPIASTFNASDRRYFINALSSGKTSSGEFIRSRLTSQPVFNLASAYKNAQNEIDGVFIVAFTLGYYNETLRLSPLSPHAHFMLLDHKGIIIYSSFEKEKYVGTEYNRNNFNEMIKGPDIKTYSGQVSSFGVKSILSYRKLRLAGENTPYLYIRVAVPEKEVLAEANMIMVRNILFFTLSLCAALALAWFAGKRSIADRIDMLEKASRKMADGDLNVNISTLDTGGEIGKLGQTFRDMAEKLKARETALAESENNYRTIFNTNKDALFIHNASTGKIIEVNDSVLEMFSFTREEIIGKDVTGMSFKESSHTSKESQELMRKTFNEGPQTFEWLSKRKNGESFWTEVILSSAIINKTNCIIAAVRDITERKEAEEERKKLQNQLYQVQKMESVGQLAGGIAHDFNNILATIMGYGSIMQDSMKEDDPNRESLEEIMNSADRAANLTQSLLAFSRKQLINPKEIEINEHILRIEKFLTRIIGEDIILTTDLYSEKLWIYADATQIEQVLMNIAANARDAMPSGGRLIISTYSEFLKEDDVITIGYGLSGECAVIEISDNGTGMDEETRKKIFDPFFTTKETGKGTGLGLSIVYGIIRQNKGHISVYSEKGKGTTFRIYLPLITAEKKSEPSSLKEISINGGVETILLAEDNETLREINSKVLKNYGYTVISAENGEEAILKFRENKDRIDIIILDIIMPKKNGREVFDEAKRLRPDIKVLFTSGYPADLIAKQGVLEKGINFIPKPSPTNKLLRKIRELLDQTEINQ
ncbi:MAG: PAS domain S-box protein [Spirochaetes bacterium]|nr:PAS domain S-box protein [Spirochaetota bacterium]